MSARLLITILFVLASQGAQAQVPSSCTPTTALASVYANDAKDMALARMYAIQSPDTSLIEIPATHADSVMRGLAAIFNTGVLLEADSIFRAYCVHAVPHGFTRNTIKARVDTNYAWAKQWSLLNTITGNTALDNFMSLHGCSVKYYSSFSSYPDMNNVATISASRAINCKIFADSLALFTGVYYAYEEQGVPGDGDHIYYAKDTVQTYTFFAGWGDCPSGCTAGKSWKYSVDTACNVTLLSTQRYGNEVHTWMPYCDMAPLTTPIPVTELKICVYPNPAKDILHISKEGIEQPCEYTISDIFGKSLFSGTIVKSVTINVSTLPTGVYVLHTTNQAGLSRYEKFVKN